jgi:hypothetical protein
MSKPHIIISSSAMSKPHITISSSAIRGLKGFYRFQLHKLSPRAPRGRGEGGTRGDRGGTRRVRLVREEGRDVSSQYGREGEGGTRGDTHRVQRRGHMSAERLPHRLPSHHHLRARRGTLRSPGPPRDAQQREVPPRGHSAQEELHPPPPPPYRTERTRRLSPPVLIGHAASLTPY